MEIIGTQMKVKGPNIEVRKTSPRDVDSDLERRNAASLPEVSPTASSKNMSPSRAMLQPAKAMTPKKGLIRLTAIEGELLRPHDYFPQSQINGGIVQDHSFRPQLNSHRMGRHVWRPSYSLQNSEIPAEIGQISPTKMGECPRMAGTMYVPESLKFFGRQLTMVDLTNTVDNLFRNSSSSKNPSTTQHYHRPLVDKLDRELTMLTVSNIRGSMKEKPSSRRANFSRHTNNR